MERRRSTSQRGMALAGVIMFTIVITIVGVSALHVATTEAVLAQREVRKHEAFYLAEAGVADLVSRLAEGDCQDIEETPLGAGAYEVAVDMTKDPAVAVSTGRVGTVVKRIEVGLSFLARPYEEAIYACNMSGTQFVLTLRGQGNPVAGGGRYVGGRDSIYGDMLVDGNVALYQESSVNPPLAPNPYALAGDVKATGQIDTLDSASISGARIEGVAMPGPPDLLAMSYATKNTHNLSSLFGGSDGRLPSDHELYNVVVKNPTNENRLTECASTVGDDYFFEPASGFVLGSQYEGATPLQLGENNVYYVDGNVWFHSGQTTYGFSISGSATIVATGNVYICDNLQYADSDSLMGLVALGQYNSADQVVAGGNIFFGDPRFGTTYTVSALMFAANDFLYNTHSVTGDAGEPDTGFTIFGNLTALNHVSINRDWYTDSPTYKARPASQTASGQWVDAVTGDPLTSAEISNIRHYQMKVIYDDRVRNLDTQPPSLPRGGGQIYSGIMSWREL